MTIIGTAGHVDHGKSTLVQALTGRNPDRWQEEKERGLTIDLGFAWMTLPNGIEVSFVDLPGHHRFIKNMLAGVEGIDLAVLVVAADEGWMPQSEEHASVIDTLGIESGVAVITKIDRVDADTAELVQLETEEKLAGLSLSRFPVVAVSAVSGEGMSDLVTTLAAGTQDWSPSDQGRPRMWVDRSFSVEGVGTVVTGSLLGGRVSVGDSLALYPSGEEVRIRGIQTHERSTDSVLPGRRVALNLSGVNREEIGRGEMLGQDQHWQLTSRLLLVLKLARYVPEPPSKGAFQLHFGSTSVPFQVRWLGVDTEEVLAVAELSKPVPLGAGDRVIVREVGRQQVIAGGKVLDPFPPPHQSLSPTFLTGLLDADMDPDQLAQVMLTQAGAIEATQLSYRSGGGTPATFTRLGDFLVSSSRYRELATKITEAVAEFHRRFPLRPGITVPELSQKLAVSAELVVGIVAEHPDLTETVGMVAQVDFGGEIGVAGQQQWEEVAIRLELSGLAVPSVAELDIDPELVHALERQGKLVRVAEFVYLPAQIERILSLMGELPPNFTVSDFRQAAGISRKYAVPILEWSDRQGHTIRTDNLRRLR